MMVQAQYWLVQVFGESLLRALPQGFVGWLDWVVRVWRDVLPANFAAQAKGFPVYTSDIARNGWNTNVQGFVCTVGGSSLPYSRL